MKKENHDKTITSGVKDSMASITPIIDIAFKKLFGTEENKDLLISFINSVVSEEDQLTEVTLLNPYNPKNFLEDKLSVLDIKAKGANGKLFNIEIQLSNEEDYDKRALYYWGKLYTEQLKNSGAYSSLSKTIGIHVLNFITIGEDMNEYPEKYHHVFHITEQDRGFHYFKDFEVHTIELKKFTNNFTNKDFPNELSAIVSKVQTSLDMWVAFLTKHDLLNPEKLPSEFNRFNKQELVKALEVLEVMNLNSEEREVYEGRLKWYRMELSALEFVEKRGMKRGLEQGHLEKSRAIAKNLKSKGFDIAVIVETTGLTEEEIKKL